ncbi:MAG TPA: hypothetical protein VFZ65_06425 [Planctomycetota bacterium]|nr:hypothetical protein [Planctomycetota bacterium]
MRNTTWSLLRLATCIVPAALAAVGAAGSLTSQVISGAVVATPAHETAASTDPAATPINGLIGDQSFVHAFGGLAARADETLRIRTHLAYVEDLLRHRDVSDLPAELQRTRRQHLDRLRAYHQNGVFPRNYDHPGERRPCFIDRDGRMCAVGYLVEQSAGRELAEAINARFQYSRIVEMRDERLDAWARGSGLTVEELATIQPGYVYPAGAYPYGNSCAPSVPVAPYVVKDAPSHFGSSGVAGPPFWWPAFWWMPAPPGAQWIAPAHRGGWGPTYVLTHTFDLTGFDPITASLSGVWSATPGSRILLNGLPTGALLPQTGSWTTPQPFAISSGFVAGPNVVQFELADTWAGYLGLLVANLGGTAAKSGTQQAIPGLFNTGVDDDGVPLPAGSLAPHYASNEPPLRAVGRPTVPNPDFGITVDTLPNRVALLALSLWPNSIPLGQGCEILVDPATVMVTALGLTDAAGRLSFPVPIPLLQGWSINFGFYAQAIVEDPSSSLGGLSLTQGLNLLTGY